jgi:hypothetical protein
MTATQAPQMCPVCGQQDHLHKSPHGDRVCWECLKNDQMEADVGPLSSEASVISRFAKAVLV